jgi:hypothetical protein
VLTIIVPGEEYYDEKAQEFVTKGDVVLELEHSLVSLSKWESKWEKPFLGTDSKTTEEVLSYIEEMCLSKNPRGDIFHRLSQKNLDDINTYINAKMTATWFSETNSGPSSTEVVTSELIYYWLTVFSIPFECKTWHLNRLLTLIKICNVKNSKPKKMSRSEMAQRNRELNAKRQAEYGTRG